MTDESLVPRIEEYAEAMARLEKFSGAILLARAGRVLYSAGYGLADREHLVLNTPRTKFRLGSITKQFTAVSLMMLQERGRLNIHDRINCYLPDSPGHWNEITIHQVLNHSSGLGNLADIPGCQETTARLTLLPHDLMETFRQIPLEFPAGTKFRYSNSGYILLGVIIERVSGESYAGFLKAQILDPLEMADTGYDSYAAILANRAAGYCRHGGEWVRAPFIDMSFPFSAGALYSTVEDLHRWDRALLAGRLIGTESLARMTEITPGLTDYGYGFLMGREFNRRSTGHAGGINGFRANFVQYPDDAACIIVLCNTEASDFLGMTKVLTAILFGEKYEIPVE